MECKNFSSIPAKCPECVVLSCECVACTRRVLHVHRGMNFLREECKRHPHALRLQLVKSEKWIRWQQQQQHRRTKSIKSETNSGVRMHGLFTRARSTIAWLLAHLDSALHFLSPPLVIRISFHCNFSFCPYSHRSSFCVWCIFMCRVFCTKTFLFCPAPDSVRFSIVSFGW